MADMAVRIGNKIRSIRTNKNLSLEAISERCGIDPATLSKLERGESNPTIQTLCRVAEAFDVDFEELVNSTEYQEGQAEEALIDRIYHTMRRLTSQQQSDVLDFIDKIQAWK